MRGINILLMAHPAGGGAGGGGGTGTTFNPVPGTYNSTDYTSVTFQITASASVVWSWSKTGAAVASTVTSGNSATSIEFTVNATTVDKSATITCTSGTNTWTINLTALYQGGGTTPPNGGGP